MDWKRYGKNVVLSFDQFWNAVLGGDPDETISSRMGKWLAVHINDSPCQMCRYIAKPVCWVLNLIDPDHCRDAIDPEEGQMDLFHENAPDPFKSEDWTKYRRG